jgi:hypothetical protein
MKIIELQCICYQSAHNSKTHSVLETANTFSPYSLAGICMSHNMELQEASWDTAVLLCYSIISFMYFENKMLLCLMWVFKRLYVIE